jgi:signal transduction histidine kinase
MLCLVYMGWHAHATRSRSAREAAQQATLDLADRTCHELGNVAFVLANERRNLAEYLGRTEAFAEQHPELVARALERANVPEDLAARIRRALAREMEDRGFEADSQEGSRLARETCHQIDVCADFIALTVRELDGYLRQTQMPVRLTALDVSDCLDDALALLGPGLAAADARVDRRDRDGDRARALADRRLLVHALVNVLKNGLEAARSVGRTPILKVSVQPRGNRLVIEVDDNGPGIPPEIRRTLFQPGTSTKGQGRGRGLAIVKDALAAQGGEVEVESVLGAGATFRINLPVAAGEHER